MKKASEADVETRAATVEERINLWKTEQQIDDYIGENKAQPLEELLDDLEAEDLITEEERSNIEETKHLVIGSKDIIFSNGLTGVSYTITSSLDEVIFNKIITEGDITAEKPGFENYEIEGIMATKDEEPKLTEPVEGKSGNLEVVGDISNATFKYNLTNFMQGDEIFYCKINIDGEDYYKEIRINQGDIVTYEEDFAGITYEGTWEEDENENYSDNKAKMATATSGATDKVLFSYYGKGFDIKTKVDSDVTVLMIKTRAKGSTLILKIGHIETEYGNLTDKIDDTSFFSDETSENTQMEITLTTLAGEGGHFYIDAITIYK